MKLELSINTSDIKKRIATYQGDIDASIDKAVFRAANAGIALMLNRTERGQGINSAFAPYSTRYANLKKQGWAGGNGRSAFSGDPSGEVNLTVTGRMLSSLIAVKRRGYAEIKFSNGESAKKAYFNNRRRPFFGFNSQERKQLTSIMRREIFKK